MPAKFAFAVCPDASAGVSGANFSSALSKIIWPPGRIRGVFPYNVQSGFKFWLQRSETKFAFFGGVDEFVQGNGITDPGFHHDCGVIDEIEGNRCVQLVKIPLKPFDKFVF